VSDNEVVIYDLFRRNALKYSSVATHPSVRQVHGDVMDLPSLMRATEGCQIVVHCAAIAGIYSVVKSRVATLEVNMLGTYHALQAAGQAGVKRFVQFSTSEVYGPFIHKGHEGDVCTIGPTHEARWAYAASKLASEHLAFAYGTDRGFDVTVVRPFNVYGDRQIGEGAIQRLVLRALANQPIVLYGDGTQIRSWCFIEDFVDGLMAILDNNKVGDEVFNLGDPQGTTTNLELARMIKRLTGSSSEIVFQPHPGPEVEVRVPSVEKARDRLGFVPRFSLEEGILKTIEWYRAHCHELPA
jgi:nucleoside-diphosphate-sugar epimerase